MNSSALHCAVRCICSVKIIQMNSSTIRFLTTRLPSRPLIRSLATGRPPLPPTPRVPPKAGAAQVQSSKAGTGAQNDALSSLYMRTKDRTPVSWSSLFVTGVAAASAVAYYKIERERRLERAMGKVVSSESEGWTPRPGYLAPRKFVPTKWGWFPQEDGFGARELFNCVASVRIYRFGHACLTSFVVH